jgi:hypothetical protein
LMSAHGTRPTWRKMPDLFPRGFCCHEAGHATVAFWLGIRVVAVSVIFTEERGWYGKTVTEGTPDLWENQIMLLMAGKAAEKVFNCSADRAWLHDAGTVDSLLDRMGMTREEREARIDEGKDRARLIVEGNREQALRLVAYLVEHGHVKEPEFLRLMHGEA